MSLFGLSIAAIGLSSTALAVDPIDIGSLKNRNIKVVQKILYEKSGLSEVGALAGIMPFDAFTVTPKLDLSYGKHMTEKSAWEVVWGLGYGLKNGDFKELEGPSYGITPDAYRYLTSISANYQIAPVYAKFSWDGKRVFHHDAYALFGAGLSVEQAFMEDGDMAFSPSFNVGVGTRIYLPNKAAIRIQIKDAFNFQSRDKTQEVQSIYLKQNVTVSIGYVMFRS